MVLYGLMAGTISEMVFGTIPRIAGSFLPNGRLPSSLVLDRLVHLGCLSVDFAHRQVDLPALLEARAHWQASALHCNSNIAVSSRTYAHSYRLLSQRAHVAYLVLIYAWLDLPEAWPI